MSTAETFALLEAAQSGDEEAGERVLRENTGLIWSVVRRLTQYLQSYIQSFESSPLSSAMHRPSTEKL